MPIDPLAVLAILIGLQIKHLLFDFAFQNAWQIKNKGFYGHPGGLVHAGLHGLGTWIVFALVAQADQTSWAFVFAITGADMVIHYHIDWLKAQISRKLDLRPPSKGYWMAFGGDQMAHQLTYLGLVSALVAIS